MEDSSLSLELLVQAKKQTSKEKVRKILYKTLLIVIMTVIAIFMMFPFYCSVLLAFGPSEALMGGNFSLIPKFSEFTNTNFELFFEYNIFKYMGNTLFVIAMIMIFQLLLCCMGGYALAKLRIPFKKVIEKIFYASMMIPGIISLIPSYIIIIELGLSENLWGIIVPATYSIYGCLFMRSFFVSTPSEIAEAARIDGANEFIIFLRLYMPMVTPGLITLGLFTFNANWNNYLWPSLIIREESNWLMAIAIKEFESLYGAEMPASAIAGSIVTILPTMLIFIVGQKYFLDNLTFAGIK